MEKIDIRSTDEYKLFNYKVVDCPVCNHQTLDNHYICPNCGWEYDGITDESILSPANNNVTIYEYKKLNSIN